MGSSLGGRAVYWNYALVALILVWENGSWVGAPVFIFVSVSDSVIKVFSLQQAVFHLYKINFPIR